MHFHYLHFHEIDSTNDAMLRLLKTEKPAEGFVLTTDHQTLGRGQMGADWQYRSGQNLMFSLLLKPDWLPIRQLPLLNMGIALGILEGIHPFLPSIRLKWPNDLWHAEKKLGGMLMESSLRTDKIESLVLGLGVNVLHTPENIPHAASLKDFCVEIPEKNVLLNSILNHIAFRYEQFQQKPMRESITSEFQRVLAGFGEWLDFEDLRTNEIIQGKIAGVDKNGHLLLQRKNGSIDRYANKEIRWIYR